MKSNIVSKADKISRILVIAFLILSFINLFLPDGLSARIYPEQAMYQDISNRLFALLRWANDISLIALPIAVFYKKKPFIKICTYVLPVILLLCIIFSGKYIQMYTNGYGEGIMNIRFFPDEVKQFFVNITFRTIYLAVLFILEGASLFFIILENRHDYRFNSKTEIKNFIIVTLGIFLLIMPIYAPSYVFGGYTLGSEFTSDLFWSTFTRGSFWHILWLIWLPCEIIVLYKIFSKLSHEDAYIAMVCMAIALLFEFTGIFTCFGEIVTQRYPLQLCNLASLTMLPVVLSKNKTFSRFALFVNVPGALIAAALCDSADAGITYIMNVHYIVEHSKVIVIPLLCYMLKIFQPIDKKCVKEIILDFSIYYIFVFIIGGIFTGLYYKTGNDYWSCNYLFMFNRESTSNILAFTGYLFDIHYRLFDFFDISLIHPAIYIGFTIYLMIYYGIFYFIDKAVKKRKVKVK